MAESGIAAHWSTRRARAKAPPSRSAPASGSPGWWSCRRAADSEEFLESVKVDLFPDKVYVFTPKGEILRLPRGATVVDFAYAVHTDIGNRCVAAKVDRRLTPLRTVLRNGQTVEIITAKGARPNPSWVNFVVTAKARSAVRQFLRNLRGHEARELGRRRPQSRSRISDHPRQGEPRAHESLLDEFGLTNIHELSEQIGLGERLAPVVAKVLLQTEGAEQQLNGSKPTPITVAGTEGMVVSYSRCCHPIPGDAIIGYLSTGRGVVIQRNVCGNLSEYRKQPHKWIPVTWEKNLDREFSVEIRVEATNRPGVLAEIAAKIAESGSNIEQVSVDERHEETADLIFAILVRDRTHLAQVIRRIRSMESVTRITRTCA